MKYKLLNYPIQNKNYKIKKLQFMKLQQGDSAPDFTLLDSDKNEIKLSTLKGKNIVLLFFPLAFTSTCTAELCATRDDIASYNNLNALVFGISVDSRFVLAKYKEEQQLNFPLLSDFNKTVSASYGCIYDTFIGMHGVSKRSAFVIDGNGIVKYAEVLESAGDLPNFVEIKNCLASLQ